MTASPYDLEMRYAVVENIGQAKHLIVRTRTLKLAWDEQKKIAEKNPKKQTYLAKILKDGRTISLEDDNLN